MIFSCSNTGIDIKLANNVISAVLMITTLQKYYRYVAIANINVNYKYQRESLKPVAAKLERVTVPGKSPRFTVNNRYGKIGGSVSIQFLLE
jgi:hypothetical protein